jgi:DNA invertase Pin-like site-specific DNA recombinase
LIVAIYARKSNDQTGVAEDAKSVTRQVEHACAYAKRKGWTVADEHVYVDDGISGAEFANRPGFVRLMAALKPRAPFGALVMSEESRLGREQIETAYAMKQLVTSGVRVFSYLTDTEPTLDSPMEKAMLALPTMADEMEREKARQRVTDAMTHRAHRGHWLGGYVFGYDRVEEFGEPDEQARSEAEWIRVPAPELRIVDEDLWTGAHERLAASRQNYLRHTDGRLWGRPTNGMERNHLLTGMAVCGECGSGMLARGRRYGSRRGYCYTCGAHWLRGSCSNDLEIPREMADVLAAVESEMLTPPVIEAAIARLMAIDDDPRGTAEERKAKVGAAIAKLDAELMRLAAAIAGGGSAPLATTIRDARRSGNGYGRSCAAGRCGFSAHVRAREHRGAAATRRVARAARPEHRARAPVAAQGARRPARLRAEA